MRLFVPPFVAVAMAFASTANAAPVRLKWQAPRECPTTERVLEAALRNAPATSGDPLDAVARVERTDTNWRVILHLSRGNGPVAERRFEASSCEAIADATALIVATALLPAGRSPETAPAPTEHADASDAPKAAPPVAVPTPAVTAKPIEAKATPTPHSNAHTLAVFAAGVIDAATLPSPALGAQIGIGAKLGARMRIEVEWMYYTSQSKTSATSNAGASFALWNVGARVCGAVVQAPVEISPCVGADAHNVQASGFGGKTNEDTSAIWTSGVGGVLVRWPVASWLALRAHVEASLAATRPRFIVEGDGPLHRPSALGARSGIGVRASTSFAAKVVCKMHKPQLVHSSRRTPIPRFCPRFVSPARNDRSAVDFVTEAASGNHSSTSTTQHRVTTPSKEPIMIRLHASLTCFAIAAGVAVTACSGADLSVGSVDTNTMALQKKKDGSPTGDGKTCSWGTVSEGSEPGSPGAGGASGSEPGSPGTIGANTSTPPVGQEAPATTQTTYAVGQTWSIDGGCNVCTCTAQGIACTERACTPAPGPGCTEEAKLCPDGKTSVGRVGPNCEFAACPAPSACTRDAKQCPDGSYVSRTGPNCEFAACK
jgi:hypothetical protein